MQWELLFFLHSGILGVIIYIIYDVIKSIRNVWKHKGPIVAIEDLIFWVSCGVYIFCYLYERNYGILRIYEVIAILLGSVLYGCFVSTYFEKLLTWILRKIKKMMVIPLKGIRKIIKRLKKLALSVRITLEKHRKCKEADKDECDGKSKNIKTKQRENKKAKQRIGKKSRPNKGKKDPTKHPKQEGTDSKNHTKT